MTNNQKDFQKRIEIIRTSKYLQEKLTEITTTATIFDIQSAFNKGILCKVIISKMKKLVSICYTINGVVYLKGRELEKAYSTEGSQYEDEKSPLWELLNITTEMETGEAYSIFVSNPEIFEYASVDEHIAVAKFFEKLNKN